MQRVKSLIKSKTRLQVKYEFNVNKMLPVNYQLEG